MAREVVFWGGEGLVSRYRKFQRSLLEHKSHEQLLDNGEKLKVF